MIRLKLLALLVMFTFNGVTSKCTASQSDKMMKCSALFFDSIGFYEDDDPVEIMLSLTTSSSNLEKFCANFEELRECLGLSIIENCIDLKKDITSMSDYTDFGFGFLYRAGNDVCGDGKDFTKSAQSDDVDFQLKAITKLQKQLSGKKISKDTIVNDRYFPIFVKYLTSNSSEVQAEAASAIKHLIDETPENLEVIIESKIIPALIRTLISTDENVLGKVTETLATIISKQPKLRNTYIDLNIVEPLLMSYSPEMSKQMHDFMIRILVQLSKNDVVTLSSKTENYVCKMIPVLSELIYNFDSKRIINFIQNILVTVIYKRNDILIDIEVIDKVSQLLFQEDARIRKSAFFIIFIIQKCEANIQRLLENGILEFIQNEFKDDKTHNSRLLLLFLYEIAENKKHIQPIFDAGLIPYMISYLNPKHEFRMFAISALYQILKHGTSTHIETLMDFNIIPKICQMLQYSLSKFDYNDEDHDERSVQVNAILTIYCLCEENQKALLQLNENNGKEILQELSTRKYFKPIALELLERLKKVENIDFDDKSDRDEL